MSRKGIGLAIALGAVFGWFGHSRVSDGTAYTLYRNSAAGITERIHIATFDASEADSYNNENCQQAQTLFQQQALVTVKFWCEKGRYRR
jgi:hypothetical protein